MSKLNLYIIHGTKVQVPILEDSVTWKTERGGVPAELQFTCVKDEPLGFGEGDPVQFYVDDVPIFSGRVFTKTRDREHRIKVTAYDRLRYFKNKDSLTYKDMKAAELITKIASEWNLLGENEKPDLADTGWVAPATVEDNSTLIDIILNHLDQVMINKRKMYEFYDDFGTFKLKDIEKMSVPYWIRQESLENFDYTSTIDGDTYNSIKIIRVDDSDKSVAKVYMAKSTKNINNWGPLQLVEELDASKYSEADAKELCNELIELYNRVERKLTLKGVIGDIRVRAGCWLPVTLYLGDVSLGETDKNTAQAMIVDSVTHTWENGNHSMDVKLIGGGGFVA